ncbi:MAG TPA: hypothetical protein ENH34_05210 [Phycisphaerales bacterium]|nr:hypothetical protein [Phycisphaerales bacterium]
MLLVEDDLIMSRKRFNLIIIYICILVNLFGQGYVRAEDEKVEESRFLSRYRENLIFKREIIIGGSYSDEKNEMAGKNSIGFEVLKKFSNKKGDWASFLLQMRFVRYDRQSMLMNKTKMQPAHIDGAHDWELELHDVYFKYSGPFKGRLNFRIGHFDVPYGLEQNVDTHSTLVQLMSMRNIGFKKDWGISAGGQLLEMDYEFAFTRGTGAEYIERGENYLVSGRVGTPADRNFCIGISGLYGQVIDAMAVMRGKKMGMPATWFGSTTKLADDIIRRWRVGLDSIYLFGPYTFKGEVSYGEDVNQEIINAVFETDYLFPGMDGRLEAIAQVQAAYQDITASGSNNDTFLVLGLNYRLSREVTVQTMYRHDLQRLKDTENDNVIGLQLYCYF